MLFYIYIGSFSVFMLFGVKIQLLNFSFFQTEILQEKCFINYVLNNGLNPLNFNCAVQITIWIFRTRDGQKIYPEDFPDIYFELKSVQLYFFSGSRLLSWSKVKKKLSFFPAVLRKSLTIFLVKKKVGSLEKKTPSSRKGKAQILSVIKF